MVGVLKRTGTVTKPVAGVSRPTVASEVADGVDTQSVNVTR